MLLGTATTLCIALTAPPPSRSSLHAATLMKRAPAPSMLPEPTSKTKELIGLIDGMATDTDGTFYERHGTKDFYFIRPSGNPLTAEEYGSFVSGGDVSIESASLLQLHKLDVGQEMAFAVITQKAKFTYKGEPNDDVFTATLIFKKGQSDDQWRINWVQRSSGRPPTDSIPKFHFSQDGTRRFPFPF